MVVIIPKVRTEKTGMDDNNERLPDKKYQHPINDDFGNTVPDPQKGGQYFQLYPEPRIFSLEEKNKIGFDQNTEATAYMNQEGVREILDEVCKLTEGADPSIALSEESYDELLLKNENNLLNHDADNDIENDPKD